MMIDAYYDFIIDEERNYYLVRKDQKCAIFDKEGKRISDWWDDICYNGLLSGESTYYIVKNEKRRYAIINVDGKRISEWWKYIYSVGLVEGHSRYYIVRNEENQHAIIDVDGNRISSWWEWIDFEGLVKGQSIYYIVRNKDGKKAIIDVEGKRISEWWDDINWEGLVNGKSDYYLVEKKIKQCDDYDDWLGVSPFKDIRKSAMFHVSGEMISSWWDDVYEFGLVDGSSKSLYIVEEAGKIGLAVLGIKEPLIWLDATEENLEHLKKVISESNLEIPVLNKLNNKQRKKTELKF